MHGGGYGQPYSGGYGQLQPQQKQPQQQQQQQQQPQQQQQKPSYGRSIGAAPFAETGNDLRSSYQDPLAQRSYATQETSKTGGPSSALSASWTRNDDLGVAMSTAAGSSEVELDRVRKMLSQVTDELGKQISAGHAESRGSDAVRAEWLQKLVLQMEAKQTLSEAELRDFKTKYSGLHAKLDGQEIENDALRENLARAVRGQPVQIDSAQSEEQARMTVALKRDNQLFRAQIEDVTKRNDILQRSVQHLEKLQIGMSGENGNLMLRLQGAEQRTDQLMKQKSVLDDELHHLRTQLAGQQQQARTAAAAAANSFQQTREEDEAHARTELKNLHMELAVQQEQFEKQRSLMVQQRDGVQAGYQQELEEEMNKNTELVSRVQQMEYEVKKIKSEHSGDVARRENIHVQGIQEAKAKVEAVEAERHAVSLTLQATDKTLKETGAKVTWLNNVCIYAILQTFSVHIQMLGARRLPDPAARHSQSAVDIFVGAKSLMFIFCIRREKRHNSQKNTLLRQKFNKNRLDV